VALGPLDLPDHAGAMEIQAEVAELLGAKPSGWKVAVGPGGVPVAAPLLGHLVASGSGMEVPGHQVRFEVEVAFRLRADLPARSDPYARQDIVDAVGSVLVGVELIGPRVPSDSPFPVFLADNLGNRGYLVGQEVTGWPSLDLRAPRCTVTAGSRMLFDAVGQHPQGDPLIPLELYANRQTDRLGGLKAGQIVTTGSLCGVLAVEGRCSVRAGIDGIGTVAFRTGA
jgi:2-keto-4-pentenoate hydratase